MNERQISRAGRSYTILEAAPGTPTAPRILAVHGFLDHAGGFAPLAEAVPDAHWVAVDLPGHGASPALPLGQFYPFIDYAWDLTNLLDALEWPTSILVGHSMGGGLAALVASALPDRVAGLVLIDCPGPIAADASETSSQLGKALRRLSAQPGDRRRIFASQALARETLLAGVKISERAADVMLPRALEAVEGGWRWRADPRLRTPSLARMTEDQVRSVLAAIPCPTLALRAKDSGFGPNFQKLFESRLPLIPNVREFVLDGGHHLHIDADQACADAVNHFLSDLDHG